MGPPLRTLLLVVMLWLPGIEPVPGTTIPDAESDLIDGGVDTGGPEIWTSTPDEQSREPSEWPGFWTSAPPTTQQADDDKLSGVSGEITSPGYPESVPRYLEEDWRLTVPWFEVVRITFDDFSLSCGYGNELVLYDGADDSAKKIDSLCSVALPLVRKSTGNQMLLRLRTPYTTSGRGFKLSWRAVDETPSHYVVSPGYPGSYPNNLDKQWMITVPYGLAILLNFHWIELESCCDRLFIYDGEVANSTLLAEMWELPEKSGVMSVTNQVFLVMLTDSSITGPGFHLTWSEESYKMYSSSVKGTSGTITSPGYPSNYAENMQKTWTISVDLDKVVALTIDYVNLECGYDFLHVYDGQYDTDLLMMSLCKLPADCNAMSSSSFLFLKMTTDYSVSGTGFKITWSAALAIPSHAILSRDYPSTYYDDVPRNWMITVSPHQRIQAVVEVLQLWHYDYFNIYDVLPSGKKRIGHFQYKPSDPFSSSQNQMFFELSAVGKNSRKYLLIWTEVTDSGALTNANVTEAATAVEPAV